MCKQTHFLDQVHALDDFEDDVDNDLEVKSLRETQIFLAKVKTHANRN